MSTNDSSKGRIHSRADQTRALMLGRLHWTGRIRAARRLRKLLIGSTVLFALSLGACGQSPAPGTGDPGNFRLHQLRANPIFSVLPPGAVRISIKLHPAEWDSIFRYWGPIMVDEHFTSTAPPAQVFSFFNAEATKFGWQPANTNASHPVFPDWSKRLPGGDDASMGLDIIAGPDVASYTLGTNPVPPPGNTYDLYLSGNPIVKPSASHQLWP